MKPSKNFREHPTNKNHLLCPFCDSEAWYVTNSWIKCFLCGRMYSRSILEILPVYRANMQLQQIKKLNDTMGEMFGGFFDK